MQNQHIGLVVRAVREHAGLSRAALCRLSGIGPTAIYDLEHGKPSVRLDTLGKVLHVLNLTLQLEGPPLATLPPSTLTTHA